MLNNIVEWEELSMRDKAAFIRDAVSRGLKDIDSIKLDYNEFKKGGPTKKQVFLNTLELSLKGNSRYNTPLWRKYLTDLANMESGYNAGITNSIGAKGYFQLMPSNRSSSWNSPTLQFTEMYKMSDANMDYLRRNMTENDLKLALLKGIDIYGLMAGAHLGGAKNALKALRGTGNAKDMNGTSVLSYMTRFSQTPSKVSVEGSMIPIVDNTGLASTSTPNNISLDTNIPLPIEISIPEPINIDDDNTAGNVLPEVEVIGYRKPDLVAMQEFIEDVSNSTPTMQPIYKVEPTPSIYDKMNQLSTDRVTLLQRDLEDRIIAEDRRRRLGYSYKDDFSNDIQDLRFIRNMSSKGGLLYPIGGSMITVNPGDRVSTDNCAEWSNGLLRDNGYLISGNAWGLNHVDPVFNGFEGLTRPENYNLELVKAYNHLATDNVFNNFDSKTLDVTKPYVVNMYYNNSEALESAYNDGRGVTGTHTGVLTYDEPTKKWWVTHNIHGNIHQEPFIDLLNSKGKYGVTAIYEPRKRTAWNRLKGFFGFANGGPIENMFLDGGDTYYAGTLPETYVTPFGNFNAELYPWLAALMKRMLQYDEVNPLVGDNLEQVTLKSIVKGRPGRLNTAVISPEWIERATQSAVEGGYDPALAVALMSRESTIGNDTDGPSTAKVWGESTIKALLNAGVDPYKTEQHIGLPFTLSEERKAVRQNNIEDYPYVLPRLDYRYNTMIGNHDHYNNQFPYYRIYDEAINNVGLNRAAINNWLKENYTAQDFEAVPTDPIIDALDYYKTGKYNSGWKGLYPAVRREYKEVINNPQIMSIINNAR